MNRNQKKNRNVNRVKPVQFAEVLQLPEFNILLNRERQQPLGRRNFASRLFK